MSGNINRDTELDLERLKAAGNVGKVNEIEQNRATTFGKDYDIQKLDLVRIIQDALSNGNFEVIKELLVGEDSDSVKKIIISELENDGNSFEEIKSKLQDMKISVSDSEIHATKEEEDNPEVVTNSNNNSFDSMGIVGAVGLAIADLILDADGEENSNPKKESLPKSNDYSIVDIISDITSPKTPNNHNSNQHNNGNHI